MHIFAFTAVSWLLGDWIGPCTVGGGEVSDLPLYTYILLSFYFFIIVFIYIFLAVRVCLAVWALLSLPCAGFSPCWLLLLQSAGSGM